MARDYWVETLPSGHKRFVKTTTTTRNVPLRRSNTHDGSQSSRSRRVDFIDVTRSEHNNLLSRERSLRQAIEDLTRENFALRANWRSCDDELRQLQGVVPSLETHVRKLEAENGNLRLQLSEDVSANRSHHHHSHDEELRRLRHRNTKLRKENDSLLSRLGRLEREMREGVSDRTRRLAEEVAAWKRRSLKYEDEAERLHHKLDSVVRRSSRLEETNQSLAREDRDLRALVEYYRAVLRRYGIPTR